MGKKRLTDLDLPQRVYKHRAGYRYVPKDGSPINLGQSLEGALYHYSMLIKGAEPKPPSDSGTEFYSKLIGNRIKVKSEPLITNKQHTRLLLLAGAAPVYRGPGIYFLFNGQELVYVGQSVNVADRIGNHARSEKEFDSVATIKCAIDKLDETEASYIAHLKPTTNKRDPILDAIRRTNRVKARGKLKSNISQPAL